LARQLLLRRLELLAQDAIPKSGKVMVVETERLWAMWRDEANQRQQVGQLWHAPDGYRFSYEAELPPTFHLLAEFPEHRGPDRPYHARNLFSTFAERIPSPKRPDYRTMLDSWGVENPDDQLEILARSGGIQATDWIELSEWRPEADDLTRPLLARVAGLNRWPGVDTVGAGDTVELRREPSNQWDPFATELFLQSGLKLGYVPKPYTKTIASVLDTGAALRGRMVTPIGLEGSYPRWLMRIERAA